MSLPIDPSRVRQWGSIALASRDLSLLKKAIEHGFDVNGLDRNGRTCLHRVILDRWFEAFMLLLDSGADVNKRSRSGGTPFLVAAWNGNAKMASELERRGADIHVRTKYGHTALHAASDAGSALLVEGLLQRLHPNTLHLVDFDGESALHWACKEQAGEVIRLLIVAGIDTAIRDNEGRLAEDLAKGDARDAYCMALIERERKMLAEEASEGPVRSMGRKRL